MKEWELAQELVDDLVSVDHSTPFVIAISGDGGLGKTTLALAMKSVATAARHAGAVLDCDAFLLERSARKVLGIRSGDDPQAIDFEGLHATLRRIRQTSRPIFVATYEHSTGTKSGLRKIDPAEFVLVDGTCSLYSQVVSAVDVGIFLDADDETRYCLRKEVDCNQRGYTPEEFELNWLDYRRIYDSYLVDARRHATYVVSVTRARDFAIIRRPMVRVD